MKALRNVLGTVFLPLLVVACAAGEPQRLAGHTDPDDESGLGGTGIIGAVTGFGSIFVNGVEVEIDRRTRLLVDGEAVAGHRFERGEVVEILAAGRGLMEARRLEVRHEVIGPVQNVDPQARRLRILGQTVLAPPQAGALPQVGERLAVSGFRDAAGRIHATRLAPAGPGAVLLRGPVVRDGDGGFRIGAQAVRVAGRAPPAPGTLVRVRGELRGAVLQASRLTPLEAAPFGAAVRRLLVQGFVQPTPRGHAIDGLAFAAAAAQPPVATTRPLRLDIRRDDSGRWRLAGVVDERHMPLGRPKATPRSDMRWRPPGFPAGPGGMPRMPSGMGRGR